MDPRKRLVSEVMQAEVATLAPAERLDLVEDVMRLGRIRHMPVLDEGRVVGLVSNRDLLAASLTRSIEFEPSAKRTFLRSVEVAEVMSRDLVTVELEANLRQAASLMIERKIGSLLVVKPDGTLLGLITETDLLAAALLDEDDASSAPAEEVLPSHLGAKLAGEFEALKRTRDELRVQIRLAKADARDLWDRTECKFEEVERKLRLASRKTDAPLREVVRVLLREIRDGYHRIRQTL